MAILPQPFLAGGYTIEYLGALLQPHHKEVLYVVDGILYAEPTIETCVAKFKNRAVKLISVGRYSDEHTKQLMLMEDRDDSQPATEWWFFREDVVEALLNM